MRRLILLTEVGDNTGIKEIESPELTLEEKKKDCKKDKLQLMRTGKKINMDL